MESSSTARLSQHETLEIPRAVAAAVTLDDTLAAPLPVSSRSHNLDRAALGPAAAHLTSEELRRKTVFYLAYGSNLCRKTFLGRRGIRPLGAANVVVPQLKLTFDLPGIPYREPCFANSADRRPADAADEKGCSRCRGSCQYRKDEWRKGLVGVVYELTLSDFAQVMATEGGGASYQDVKVDCYKLAGGANAKVPWHPEDEPAEILQAHTLFAPASDSNSFAKGGRYQRPDPGYAQPSRRYLDLLASGAVEHDLPTEYRDYLARIRPYRATSIRQSIGGWTFIGLFGPVFLFFVALVRLTANKKGRAPKWLANCMLTLFRTCWTVYDNFFKGVFGDGERTVGDYPDCDCGGHNGGSAVRYTDLDEKRELQPSLV